MDGLRLNSFEIEKRQQIKNEPIRKIKSRRNIIFNKPRCLAHLNNEEHDAALDVYEDVCGKKGDRDNACL